MADFRRTQGCRIDGWTIDGAKAGPAFRTQPGKVKALVENLPPETMFPMR